MLLLASGVILFVIIFTLIFDKHRGLPPGPVSLPIVGSIFSLRYPLHRHFRSLSARFGPIVHLKCGMVHCIVVNTLEVAQEVLHARDSEFAYRPRTRFGEYFSYGFRDIALAPPGKPWQALKQINFKHLMNPQRLVAVTLVHEQEIAKTIEAIQSTCCTSSINLSSTLSKFTSDAFCLALFGKKEERILDLVALLEKQTLNVNIGNCIPALDSWDLHGVNRRMKDVIMPELESVLSQVIQQHSFNREKIIASGQEFVCGDLTDVLLESSLPEISVIAMLTNLVAAGVDTIKGTLIWAMAEVINNQKVMSKAQDELQKTIGTSRRVKHSDLRNLPYIDAIFRETLRLHPIGPLGVPHYNPKESSISGYKIPKESTILINLWAIGRDPRHWDKPEVFRPERFLGDHGKGKAELMLPFSSGKRICAGFPLASCVIPLVIASLLHAFKWRESDMQLRERCGTLSCVLDLDLIATPIPMDL